MLFFSLLISAHLELVLVFTMAILGNVNGCYMQTCYKPVCKGLQALWSKKYILTLWVGPWVCAVSALVTTHILKLLKKVLKA